MAKKGKKKFNIGVLLLIILLLSGGVFGFLLFSGKMDFSKEKKNNETKVDKPVEIKKLQIIDEDSTSRPIAVMINNHPYARPYHTGLQDAYLVYEIIVEGGITRYMAVFKDKDTEKIGSVRSSRHYFLDYALENDAVYVHWGWSPEAEKQIKKYSVNNLDGIAYEGVYFFRDNSLKVAYEHRGFTSMELIKKGMAKKGYSDQSSKETLLNYSIDAVDLSKLDGAIPAEEVLIPYSGSIETSYKYDATNKNYLRYVNGKEHTDYVTKKQFTAKNIITYQVSNWTMTGDVKGRQDIDNIGTGKGYYISDGYAVPIKWEKKYKTSQTVYTLEDGTEINVNDGNTFIQIQPSSKKLTINGSKENVEES